MLLSPSSPMDDPRVRLVRSADVVLGQQAGQPGAQRRAVQPALAGCTLLHRRHEDEVSLQQLQLVVVLRHIRVHHLKCLQ